MITPRYEWQLAVRVGARGQDAVEELGPQEEQTGQNVRDVDHIDEEFERLSGGSVREGFGMSEAPTATHVNPIFKENRTYSSLYSF